MFIRLLMMTLVCLPIHKGKSIPPRSDSLRQQVTGYGERMNDKESSRSVHESPPIT